MATVRDWAKYQLLRDLIAEALEEAGIEDNKAVSFVISPALDQVYATAEPWWDDETLNMALSANWFFESAASSEDALEIADKYFDLR